MTVHLLLHRVHIDPCPLCKKQCKGHVLAGEKDWIWEFIRLEEKE